MKNKMMWMYIGLAVLLLVTGFVVYKVVAPEKDVVPVAEEVQELVSEADSSLLVSVAKSKVKDNAVVLTVSALASKYATVAYELTYDSQGLIKGVNSGSKPVDVAGKDTFEREVYLGTCSRNVCKADAGVKSVSVALEFTDTSGKKSQFSKDYTL